jgi:hypothetical protein
VLVRTSFIAAAGEIRLRLDDDFRVPVELESEHNA